MDAFLKIIQALILALWVGAMFGFGALYAPVLFRTLKSRDQAGSIAGETIGRLDSVGLVFGGILALVGVLQVIALPSGVRILRLVLSLGMLVIVLFSSISVRQRLHAVRQQMSRPIDELDETEPLRVEYNKYHRLSTRLYSVNLLLGAGLIVLGALS